MIKAALKGGTKAAAHAVPATAVAAVAALSLGAYAGHADSASVRGAKPTFTVSATPTSDTIAAGSQAGYRLRIHRKHFPWRVTFKVRSGLPIGAAVHFMPQRTSASKATLAVSTSATTPPGRYELLVRVKHGGVIRRITLQLTVADAAQDGGTAGVSLPQYSVSGNVTSPLYPGEPQPIDVQFTNPNPAPLTVTGLSTTVVVISAPHATSGLPCTSSDFSIQQYSRPTPLTVPASSTRRLSQLGVPSSQWPQISLLDLPANQDGCQGAELTLKYDALTRFG